MTYVKPLRAVAGAILVGWVHGKLEMISLLEMAMVGMVGWLVGQIIDSTVLSPDVLFTPSRHGPAPNGS